MKLIYYPRNKRQPADGPWWLEVAVVPDRNANPLMDGHVLATFEMTADALPYAFSLTTLGRDAYQMFTDDTGEVGAIMATVDGNTASAAVVGGKLEIDLGRAGRAAYVVVRPCHAPGEPAKE